MYQSWRYVQCTLFWKNQHNVKTVNVVTQIFAFFCFSRIQTYRVFYFLRKLFGKHQTLSSQCRIFSSWSRSHKIRLLSISKIFLFIVVIVISILLKTAFSQISCHNQLLAKILQRSDKEKTTFKAIEKYRYSL